MRSRRSGRAAHLPTTMGLVQPGTRRGMLEITIGSRNTVPLRMLRIVPLGLFHIWGEGAGREGEAEQRGMRQEQKHGQCWLMA